MAVKKAVAQMGAQKGWVIKVAMAGPVAMVDTLEAGVGEKTVAAVAVWVARVVRVAGSRRNDRSLLTVMRADQTPSPRSVLETQAPHHYGRCQTATILGHESYSRPCPARLL